MDTFALSGDKWFKVFYRKYVFLCFSKDMFSVNNFNLQHKPQDTGSLNLNEMCLTQAGYEHIYQILISDDEK